MATPPLAEWDHSLFAELQRLLTRIAADPTTSTLRRFHQKLEEAQPWLMSCGSMPGPSERDKGDVEQKSVSTPSGSSIKPTADLLTAINTISTTLNISQILAATLCLQAEEERPRYPSRSNLEISVFTYYEWEAQMLDFLSELLRLTVSPDADLSPPFDAIREWVEGLLAIRYPLGPGRGEGALVDQIILQLDELQSVMSGLMQSGGDYELLSFRVGALRAGQNKLARILARIAEAGLIGRGQVVKLLKWLRKAERPDSLVVTVMAAVMMSFKPIEFIDQADSRYDVTDAWIHDIKFLRLAANLILQEEWKFAQIRDTVRISFSIFYLSALRHDSAVTQSGIEGPMAEQFIQDAIAAEILPFLRELVRHIADDAEDSLLRLATRSDPDNVKVIYRQIQELVDTLAMRKSFLRNLRNKEEDRRSQPLYQDFLLLLSVLYYALPPDSADHLWDNTTFVGLVLDTRGNLPGAALCAMLAAISTGTSCAAKSYDRLRDSRIPWTTLSKLYQHYIDIMPHLFEPMKANRSASLDPMSLDEAETCREWTKLLATIVRYSPLARSTLLQGKPHPIQQLFDLLNCDIPLDVKAGVVEAIDAFCAGADDDVRSRVAEHYERITYQDASLDTRYIDSARLPPPIGWVAKMEYSEVEVQTYPLTRAYIRLLTSLLPTSHTRLLGLLRRATHYIFDRILLMPQARSYGHPAERWDMFDAIIAFMEKALLSFDMSELAHADQRAIGTVAVTIAEHPGFAVLLRLLSEPPIFSSLAQIVDLSDRPETLTRVLRIYHRVLDIQLVFSDVLVLTLSHNSPFRRPLGLQSLDHHLLTHLSNVNAIALLVGSENLTISLVSVKILQALAQSPAFSRSDIFRGEYARSVNRLAGILDASDDSLRIAQGFCTRLDGEGDVLSAERMRDIGKAVLLGDSSEELSIVIRSTILDILIDGTMEDEPNMAHFLLGFNFKVEGFGLQDPHLPESRLSCLHIILRQLCEGEIIVHPLLAAKSAQIVHQLFSSPHTGKTTMAYAASVAAFSETQLSAMPGTCPSAPADTVNGVVTGGTEVETSAEVLVAYLDYQKWILSSVALDVFAFEGRGTSAIGISELLFGDDHSGALLVSFLSKVENSWLEPMDPTAHSKNLDFFGNFDFDQFKRGDVDWWDLELLRKGMTAYQRQIKQGDSVGAEIDFVIARLAQKNRETDISLAKGAFLVAWNGILKISLSLLLPNIAEEQQQIVLFQLLDALFGCVADNTSSGVLEVLSESILAVTSALVSVLAGYDASNLPVDRLGGLLQGVVDLICRSSNTENARGNLYACISQYLQLLTPYDIDDASIAGSSSGSVIGGLHRATMVVLNAKKDRFLATVSRDAMDDRDVWKTECFALLGGLVAIGQRDRQLLSPLSKGGFLSLFVRSLKDSEVALQDCLSPDPENLYAFWVYEAKIAFLLSYAGSRAGAEQLLDAGIFEVLSTCGFITVQPITTDLLESRENVFRQHHVLVYSLQLLVRILSSLAKSSRTGAGHGISFLNAHRESLLILLREVQACVTTLGIEEAQLVVSLVTMVVYKVPAESLRSASGFGAFHSAILSLAARFFDNTSWTTAPVHGENADSSVLNLNQTLLVYLCATTSGLKGGSGSPVLVTGAQRSVDPHKHIATAPSLQTVVDLLSDLLDDLQAVGNDYDIVAERVRSGQTVEDVDIQRFQSGLVVDAESAFDAFSQRVGLLHNAIESILLLTWRHILFYASDARGSGELRPGDLSQSLSAFSTSKSHQLSTSRSATGTLRVLERVAGGLKGSLERLDDIVLAPELVAAAAGRGVGDAYHGMLVRRMRELIAGILEPAAAS